MRTRLTRLLTFPAGRRSKWVVLVLGVVLAFGVAGSQAGQFEDAQENEASSFLPGDSESLAVNELQREFPSGENLDALAVYQREGELTAEDERLIASHRQELNENPPPSAEPVPPPAVSEDGTTALLPVTLTLEDPDDDRFLDATEEVREVVGDGAGGLQIAVGGGAGSAADQIEVFEQIDGTLLLGTALLVVVLLIVIYRSPIFWLLPFLAVIAAEVASRGLGYGLTELGVTVNGQSASILVVLVFGAGTDYALLIVARYREELRRHEDKHEAMALALRRAGPAIIASGLTVMAALLCLTLAELNGTAGLGPIGAMGVALAMVTSLTLLPAIVLAGGRRAFWPFVPRYGREGADETHGVWRRVGERVRLRPRRVWMGTTVVLAVMIAGLAFFSTDLTSADAFREDVESTEAQDMLAEAFPAGGTGPTIVYVPDPEQVDEVSRALAEVPGVADVGNVERGEPGALVEATLEQDPLSLAAFDLVPDLRAAAKQAGGSETLVGGQSAVEFDVRESAERDNVVIMPVVLVVVFLILAALLRAILAPVLLIATVIVSYAAALGVGSFLFDTVFGFPGVDPGLPLFAFIFLVALGVDYNIFLMARAREETIKRGTREGIVRALAVTGTVITSAGVVLAGTFSILGVLPLTFLTEIGFVVAFGVLLDTFIVRSVLVPSLVLDIGPRIWWPSGLARPERDRDRAHEAPPEGRMAPAGASAGD
jgi:putative drug exporter of the RND superfamily